MNKDPEILIQRLSKLINGRQIKAALFYTFNFDPRFFENYIMPVLVQNDNFTGNAIANNILWRRLYKDDKVPPITVYYDDQVKSLDAGPMLNYNLIGVSVPNGGSSKGNFHCKHSFILVGDKEDESLIIFTGSNNITQNGWCENEEAVIDIELKNGKFYPEDLVNEFNNFIVYVNENFGAKVTPSESAILEYLNKRGKTNHKNFDLVYYNSFQGTFSEFITENIIDNSDIKCVEVISPYFKRDEELVKYFLENKLEVRIQAPYKHGYCLLSEDVYKSYSKAGVKWFKQIDDTRSSHSKVYRFISSEKLYTVIGSVNFTGPAWRGFQERAKEISNIESAILIVENVGAPKKYFHKDNEITTPPTKYILNGEAEEFINTRYHIPEISFVIDWTSKTLKWLIKSKNRCMLNLGDDIVLDLSLSKEVQLTKLQHGNEILEAIARCPILEVNEYLENDKRVHFYYLNQIGFEQRPLEFRLTVNDILDTWSLLSSDNQLVQDWLINRLEQYTDLAQDASGIIISKINERKSLLNEMARHFYGLVKLEQFLTNEIVWKQNLSLQAEHGNNIAYYLLHDNVDTLVSYIKDVSNMYDQGKMPGGYYWLILQILRIKFYDCDLLRKMTRKFVTIKAKGIMDQISEQSNILKLKTVELEQAMSIDKKKLKWAETIVNSDYELY